MKTKIERIITAPGLLVFLILSVALSTAHAQGTAFTYQGQLQDSGGPANGLYDLKFTLVPANTGIITILATVTNSAVGVTNGLFTTTIDFGAQFPGADRWLGIAVRTNGGDAFTSLSPRQQLTPTPYAITAATANFLTGGPDNTNIGTLSFLGGGSGNVIQSSLDHSVVVGGYQNQIQEQGSYSVIVGGSQNEMYPDSIYSAIGGGSGNQIQTDSGDCVIGGGGGNVMLPNSTGCTIPGGEFNEAGGQYSFAAGHNAQATNNGSFVWADSQGTVFSSTTNDSFSVRAQGGARFVTGGAGLSVDGPINGAITVQQNADDAPNVIEGSSINSVSSGVEGATIGGGGDHGSTIDTNSVTGDFGTVAGGDGNTAGQYATVAGGTKNAAGGVGAFVGGGGFAYLGGFNFVFGGNSAGGTASVVSGGVGNTAGGSFAMVPGGQNNAAGGQWSFAAGQQAHATNDGAFVWADSDGGNFSSTGSNQFLIRAQGGVGINTATPGGTLSINTGGAGTVTVRNEGIVPGLVVTNNNPTYSGYLRFRNHLEIQPNDAGTASGYLDVRNMSGNATIILDGQSGAITATAFNVSSDRNVKEDFAPVSAQTVLAKVAVLPITEWNYKTDAAGQKHIGPMAQDFHAAFNLNGTDDKHISVIDEGGVALAAIQGLNQKLQDDLQHQDVENTKLKRQNDLLADRLNELEATVKLLTPVK